MDIRKELSQGIETAVRQTLRESGLAGDVVTDRWLQSVCDHTAGVIAKKIRVYKEAKHRSVRPVQGAKAAKPALECQPQPLERPDAHPYVRGDSYSSCCGEQAE